MSHWTQITHFAHKNIFIIHFLGPKKELGLRESKSEHFAAAAGHKPSLLMPSQLSQISPRESGKMVPLQLQWLPALSSFHSTSDHPAGLAKTQSFFKAQLNLYVQWSPPGQGQPTLVSHHILLLCNWFIFSLSLSPSLFDWPINVQRTEILYMHAHLMTIIMKLFGVPLVFWLKNMKGRMWRRPDEERQVIIMTTLTLGGRWCYLEIVWVHSNPSAIERTIFFPSIPSQKQYGHLRDP